MQKLFPTIARMPYCLYIPSNSFQIEIKMEKCYGVRQELKRQIDSNLCVLQWALLLVLCLCLQHLRIRQCHLTFLSSFFYSTFTLVSGMLTILIFMKWEKNLNLQHLFKENCQVQPYIKFFVGDDFYPFCCHYKISFTFP